MDAYLSCHAQLATAFSVYGKVKLAKIVVSIGCLLVVLAHFTAAASCVRHPSVLASGTARFFLLTLFARCALQMDRQLNRSKGTGFVQFAHT